MAKDLKYGMVGGSIYAFIGEVHRKAINFDTRAELVCGCFSNVPAENEDTAKAYGIAPSRTYADYKEMARAEAAREDGIDFVSICTPNFLHYEIAKEFLLAGINVVCEKPLCFSVEEAQELEALAAAKDLIFAVTYGYTGNTMVKVAREMIAEGKIGKVVTVNAEYAQDWLLDELDESHAGQDKNLSVWRTDPKISGISNCVGDIGTHMENMVHYLTGLKIRRISATVNKYGHRPQIETGHAAIGAVPPPILLKQLPAHLPVVIHHPQSPLDSQIVIAENIRSLQAEQQDHLRRPHPHALQGTQLPDGLRIAALPHRFRVEGSALNPEGKVRDVGRLAPADA